MIRPSDARPLGRPKKVSPYGGRLMIARSPRMRSAFPVSVSESPKLKMRAWRVWWLRWPPSSSVLLSAPAPAEKRS